MSIELCVWWVRASPVYLYDTRVWRAESPWTLIKLVVCNPCVWRVKRYIVSDVGLSRSETNVFSNLSIWMLRFQCTRRMEQVDSLIQKVKGQALKLWDESKEKQVNLLLHLLGSESDDILFSFHLPKENLGSYNVVKERFDQYFNLRGNIIYERAVFNRRVQLSHEPVE